MALGQHDEALSHFRQSLEVLGWYWGRALARGLIYHNIAIVYDLRGDYERRLNIIPKLSGSGRLSWIRITLILRIRTTISEIFLTIKKILIVHYNIIVKRCKNERSFHRDH
ncbi:tetratricopeptide repeat protein [bacterium]|nr:tetratricopeptide repeat protein [bacterium]